MPITERITRLVDSLQNRLKRVTSSGRFVPEIDGLRFVAIFSVVMLHISRFIVFRTTGNHESDRFLALLLSKGFIGVRLFFGISGFILCLPFAEHYLEAAPGVSYRRYLLRRVTRLEPPYIINLVLLYAALVLVKHLPSFDLLPHLGASLCYLHNIAYVTPSSINGVAWSLEIEIQFYLCAPLLARVFLIRPTWLRRTILAGTALGLGVLCHQGVFEGMWYYTLPAHLEYFLVGFLLADVYVADWGKAPSQGGPLWDLVALASWLLILLVVRRPLPPGMSFLILIAYLAAFRGPLTGKLFRNRWLVTIGGMCYTIYLWHYTILSVTGGTLTRLLPSLPYEASLLLFSLLILPVMFALSSVLFLLFEKPFMRRNWPAEARQRLADLRSWGPGVPASARRSPAHEADPVSVPKDWSDVGRSGCALSPDRPPHCEFPPGLDRLDR